MRRRGLICVGAYLAPFSEKNMQEFQKLNNLRVRPAFSDKVISCYQQKNTSQIEILIRDFCVGGTINQKSGEDHFSLRYEKFKSYQFYDLG